MYIYIYIYMCVYISKLRGWRDTVGNLIELVRLGKKLSPDMRQKTTGTASSSLRSQTVLFQPYFRQALLRRRENMVGVNMVLA